MGITIVLSTAIILLIIVIIFLLKSSTAGTPDLKISALLESIESGIEKTSPLIREEFSRSREEIQKSSRETREELSGSFRYLSETLTKIISELSNNQRNQFDSFSSQLANLIKGSEERTEKIRDTVEQRLKTLQDENIKKLEEMRATVDEKLQSTLEKRLSESFNQVSERLKQVHEGLGEMKTLATGVGDLKKVLANVKTRGILGEIQLNNILENILSPDQYAANVSTKENSRENVEYAIKLPGEKSEQPVYLPVDSKFPIEVYHQLLDAYETGDAEILRRASKDVENTLKKCARDISEKYINPPYTTDFGILFLPVEGLYAEVVRQTSLIEILQRDYKIIITGPTTLAAFLNSLHMGFRTLAIQKRTSEVWKVLSSVKKEFNTFGEVLEKAQSKIKQASSDIDHLVGTRTRQIQSRLKTVEELPDSDLNPLPEPENQGKTETS